jgi:SAM-dependent methyltransferase
LINFKILLCPECCNGNLVNDDGWLLCDSCAVKYPIHNKKPILIKQSNSIFPTTAYQNEFAVTNNGSKLKYLRFTPSLNFARKKVVRQLIDTLDQSVNSIILVLGGGTQRKFLDPLLNPKGINEVIYIDIDVRADVDFFCDAHDLPFKDGVFDAVVTTAVLEHVLYPEKVAHQIRRVLKMGGLLYSEMPFMQQVHEGAYDFTRYTLSGHRRLFNGFEEFGSGMVAGPATALVWSIENFVLAFVRGVKLRMLMKFFVRVVFGWIKYLDCYLIRRPEAMDAASCTYFFGAKSNTLVLDVEIITNYVGAKHITHT